MGYRFSGHESFPCRYSWLPKAYRALSKDPRALVDDEAAMVELGVGKNMVRAIRFWVQAAGVAEPGASGLIVTSLGTHIFSEDGLDPYLEDIRTLWLIHWKIASNFHEPLYAWESILGRWHLPEFTRSEVLASFQRETQRMERDLSLVTLEQHFDVFIHTYLPTRGPKGEVKEDNLDCPLVELELLRENGTRRHGTNGRSECVYKFNREPKPSITTHLFAFALSDFWDSRHSAERTLTLREIAGGLGSPGKVFQLSEADVWDRVSRLDHDTNGAFVLRESAVQSHVVRNKSLDSPVLAVYERESLYA